MTTDTSTTDHPHAVVSRAARAGTATLLISTAGATLALGALTALVAVVVADTPAVLGSLVGTALAVTVLFGGAVMVDAVASIMPSASLMVALLTYILQLLALVLVFVALERSGLLAGSLDRAWLGSTVIGTTLVWLAIQLRLFVRQRVPAFDLVGPATVERGEGGQS